MENLIKRRVLRRLIWYCTVCRCSTKRTLGLYGLKTYLEMRGFGPDAVPVVGSTGVKLFDFFCSGIQLYVLLSPCLCLVSFLYLGLYVLEDDSWIS